MIELAGVSRTFVSREVTALENIDLNIDREEFITIMGPSGSGKTTLLHILGTLDTPDDGTYQLEGCDITQLPDRELARIRNRHFGFVFQSFYLLKHRTCMENVMLPLEYAGIAKNERKDRALEMLKLVGLHHRLDHYPSMLSGGEQQRVAIARAVVHDPDVVFADEPTGNLPASTSNEIMALFGDLHSRGVTFVIVTHSDTIAEYGRRRICIEDGGIVADTCQHASVPL